MTLKEIIEQLKRCKFKDEYGHPLENNAAFIELERLVVPVIELNPQLTKEQMEELKRSLNQPSEWKIDVPYVPKYIYPVELPDGVPLNKEDKNS